MLRDLKIEDNENWNLERFALLIYSQKKFYQRIGVQIGSEIQKEEVTDLKELIKAALEKKQWRVVLLLLTSPCRLLLEFIKELTPFKHAIINEANLKATTSHGQFIIDSNSLSDIQDEKTNLYQLVYHQNDFLMPKKFSYMTQKPLVLLKKLIRKKNPEKMPNITWMKKNH